MMVKVIMTLSDGSKLCYHCEEDEIYSDLLLGMEFFGKEVIEVEEVEAD